MRRIGSAPTISVIVPTYNRADLLPESLDAILAQTCRPLEVIVVDDGSHDATDAVLRRYGSRVRAIRIDNAGDLVARNVGLRSASGDLVAFCDSDDLWARGFLAAMAALWRAEPATKAAFGDFVIVRDGVWGTDTKFASAPDGFWNGLRPLTPPLAVFDQPLVEHLIRFQPFFPSAMVAERRHFLALGGWDDAVGRIVGSDFATILRIGEQPPVGVLRQPLVGIRKHDRNWSRDVQAMNLGDARILEHFLQTRPADAAYRPLIEASITRRRRDAFDTAFTRGDFRAVRSIYRLLPARARSGAPFVKHLVAGLPHGIRPVLASLLLFAGTVRGGRRSERRRGEHRTE